jgi:glycosyltransferase involved in cell wall biosynthesis
MKKIVILGPAHPLRGGLASYNERLAREFIHNGHSVTIYTFSLQYPAFLFPGTTQYSSEPAPADLTIEVKINSVNPFNWLKTGNELRKLKPDIVVVRYWLPFMGPALGTILRIVKKNNHSKIVCIADNIRPHEKRIGDFAFTRYFMKPVDAFITMSEKVLCDLRLFDTVKPAKFVPHPLYDNFGDMISREEARAKLGIDQDEFVFLFFGFIRKYKGLDLLLESVALLKNKQLANHSFKVLIAGEFYEDRQFYDKLIDQLNIRENLILWTDFIPDSEVKYYLCAADAVVQPYRNATQSGVTPLAYHFEVPMIVTNVGGLPSLVPHNLAGLVSEPKPAAIAEAMLLYMEKGKEYFLPHLRKEKTKYAWSNMTGAITALAGKQQD